MEFNKARTKFIHSWGVLGSSWGINKTMAQIHALLMISPNPLTTDEIIEELGISRGNVSMSLKALQEWGIVFKDYVSGDRKDYYYAEKDIWKMATQVSKERKRRELIPVMKMLDEVSNIPIEAKNEGQQEFQKITKDLNKFAKQADRVLARFESMESNWFFQRVLKLFK